MTGNKIEDSLIDARSSRILIYESALTPSLILMLLHGIRDLAIFVMSYQPDPVTAPYRHTGISFPMSWQHLVFKTKTYHFC